MAEKLLEVKNLTIKINDHSIVDDISFELKKNDTLAVIGPNGAGKSMLFRALLGFVPFEGEVKWKKGVKIGYVPQRLSVERELPLTTREFLSIKEKDIEKINSILSSVGFEVSRDGDTHHFEHHILNNKLGHLSGGELQRVLVAWALVDDPNVLLFDEPTAGVDVSSEESIYELLNHLKEKRQISLILISHELQVVNKHASTVLCLNKERLCYGPPRKVLNKEILDNLFGETANLVEHSHRKHH
jgi:zinc transport system ATP-binding protein